MRLINIETRELQEFEDPPPYELTDTKTYLDTIDNVLELRETSGITIVSMITVGDSH